MTPPDHHSVTPSCRRGRAPRSGRWRCRARRARSTRSAGDRVARQLTWGTDPVTDLDWSPDGRKLAVTRGAAAGGRRMQVLPADGRAGPEEVPWSGRGD